MADSVALLLPEALPGSEGAGEAAAPGARFRFRPWGGTLLLAWLTRGLDKGS
jgi:hypothetical protein